MRLRSTLWAAGFILLFYTLLPIAAQAGAWTRERGTSQLITGASLYRTAHYYDIKGRQLPQSVYYKEELSAYGEYGLYDDLTLGGQASAIRARQGSYMAHNLGDSELFARKRVWKNDLSVISLQPSVILPSPDRPRSTPKIGADHMAYALRASYGRNYKLFGYWDYVDITGGYVYRAGTPGDQWKLDITTGVNVSEKWQLIPQLFITKSKSKIRAASFVESSANDYDLLKAQLSVQYSFSTSSALALGAFHHVSGRNTGEGSGVLVNYTRNFP